MGRGAVVEGIQQEPKSLLRLLLRQPHHREDALLDVSPMDTDRAASDFVAVADDVVGPGERRARIGVEVFRVLRRRKGMVDRGPCPGPDGDITGGHGNTRRLEQRRIDHPTESPRFLVDEPDPSADLESGSTKQGLRQGTRTGGKKYAVPWRGTDLNSKAGAL